MKKALSIFTLLIAVILLCGITASCSDHDEDEPQPVAIPDETILMFFPYSSLEDYIKENIEYMKDAIVNRGGLGNKRLIICQASTKTSYRFHEIKFEDGEIRDTVYDPAMALTFKTASQDDNVVMLRCLLQQTKGYAPANSYSMIIGCHGSSWLPAGQTIESLLNGEITDSRSFGTADSSRQIDNESLVAALEQENMHLNFLLFDACYMGNVETAYAYRNVCDWYLSSPNEIMAHGVPYDVIGDDLFNHDYEDVVSKYVSFYTKYEDPYGTFSAVDCSQLDLLATLMKEINSSALSATTDLSSVQPMDGYSPTAPTVFFDLMDYVAKFCTDAQKAEAFNAVMTKAVPYAGHTPTFYFFYPYTTDTTIPIKTFCGLSTSQPTRNSEAQKNLESTEWWKETH